MQFSPQRHNKWTRNGCFWGICWIWETWLHKLVPYDFQGKRLLNRQVYNELYTCEPFSFSGDAVPARGNTLCGLEVLRIVFPRDSTAARNEPIGHDKSSKWLAFKIFSSVFVYGLSLSLCLISFLSLCWFCLYHCLCHERRQLGSINPPNDRPLKVSPLRLKVNWPQIRGDVHCQYSWYSRTLEENNLFLEYIK